TCGGGSSGPISWLSILAVEGRNAGRVPAAKGHPGRDERRSPDPAARTGRFRERRARLHRRRVAGGKVKRGLDGPRARKRARSSVSAGGLGTNQDEPRLTMDTARV